VTDSGARAARGEWRWPERWRAVPAGFTSRTPRKGEGKDDRDSGEMIKLSGRI
jgi:hypothetical protein